LRGQPQARQGEERPSRGRRWRGSKNLSWARRSGPCWIVSALAARPAQQQKHLYVLVDDWERGYSICKVGEEDDQPPLPLVRIEAEHGRSWFLVAHGSKIMAMWPPSESSPGIPVFDTETLGVTVCPHPRSRYSSRGCRPVYASVGDRLVAFASPYLEVLGPEPPPGKPWSWTSAEAHAQFASILVSSYAVHPDGRTIFMSVKGWKPSIRGERNSTSRWHWYPLSTSKSISAPFG